MWKRILCFLAFNHSVTATHIEDGKGSDYRYITECRCGKKKDVGPWTDDNHQLGYGRMR